MVAAVLLVLMLGVVAGLAWAVIRLAKDERTRRITLPDGTRVELLGVSLGATPFTTEKPWQRQVRRWLPARWQGWIPPAITGGGVFAGSNILHVHLLEVAPSPGIVHEWGGLQAEDETGFRYPYGAGYSSHSTASGAATTTVYDIQVTSYPRRQKDFLLHFKDNQGMDFATFRVPNPASGPFPQWRPVALPQTRTNGSVTLTLDQLEESDASGRHRIVAHSHLTATGREWTNAHAQFFTYFDATGNDSRFLSRREPAWMARTLIYRDKPEDFADGEKIVLTNLAIPAPGTFALLDQGRICNGIELKNLLVAGAGTLLISNDNSFAMRSTPPGGAAGPGYSILSSGGGSNGLTEAWHSSSPFLMVEAKAARNEDRLQFLVHSDDGQEIQTTQRDDGGAVERRFQAAFTPPQSAKTFSVTILVNRPLAFEFMIDPAEIRTVKP